MGHRALGPWIQDAKDTNADESHTTEKDSPIGLDTSVTLIKQFETVTG